MTKLKYGKAAIAVPESHFNLRSLRPEDDAKRSLTPDEMVERLASPISAPTIEDSHAAGDSVLIAISDATRKTGVHLFLPMIIEGLMRAGVHEEDIRFIFATGVHRKMTDDEKIAIIGKKIFDRFQHLDHDADSEAEIRFIGTTTRGTRVRINSEIFRASKVILTGSVDFHYHAGFSGGRKALVPGLAHRETAAANHLLCLTKDGGRHPCSDVGILDSNPVHEDMLEGALMAPSSFIANSIMNEEGGIEELFAGDMVLAHTRAAEYLRKNRMVQVPEKVRIVLAGCGGHPRDMNFVQANKCIQNCSRLVADGGVLILVAQCPEGYGSPDFAEWLAMDREAILSMMKKNFKVYAQTALAIQNVLKRISIILISDFRSEEFHALGVAQTSSLEEGMKLAGEIAGTQAEGYIIEDGPRWFFHQS